MQAVKDRTILSHYIDSNGLVDYNKLASDDWIDKVWEVLKASYEEKKQEITYWINVYNILTLKSVLIELDKNPHWQGVTSLFSKAWFFYFRKFKLGGRKISLYTVEFKILRKQFNDPRIHFAINCASKSCPYLPDRLLHEEGKDEFLDKLTSSFINEQGGVRITSSGKLQLSKIFKWYIKDFGGKEGMIEFIQDYWKGEPLDSDMSITYGNYDWSLNAINFSTVGNP